MANWSDREVLQLINAWEEEGAAGRSKKEYVLVSCRRRTTRRQQNSVGQDEETEA